MNNSLKRTRNASRRPPDLDAMIGKVLRKTDPEGREALLASLLEQHRPPSMIEEVLVETLAFFTWWMRGCVALQQQLLTQGAAAAPGLPGQLAKYQAELAGHCGECLRQLACHAAHRARLAAETLEYLEPCTFVIQ